MIPILIVFAVFFLLINSLSIRDNENQPKTLSKIELIPDTIQVNGDLLSFQGRMNGQNYQVYDTLKSLKEKTIGFESL